MKKSILLIIILMGVLCMAGCSFKNDLFRNDFLMQNEKCEELVSILKAKDKVKLKSLFSLNSIEASPSIDNDIENLFNFVEGEYISHKNEMRSSDGYRSVYYNESYLRVSADIYYVTSKYNYQIGLQTYFLKEKDVNEEGVRGIYVQNVKEENADVHFEIYQNGDYYQGICIEDELCSKNEKERVESIIKSINNKDKEAFIELFANNIKNDINNINELFTYFDGNIIDYYGKIDYNYLGLNSEYNHKRINSIYIFKTEVSRYCLAIQTVLEDELDYNNVGINTIYLTKVQDENFEDSMFNLSGGHAAFLKIWDVTLKKWDNGVYIIFEGGKWEY